MSSARSSSSGRTRGSRLRLLVACVLVAAGVLSAHPAGADGLVAPTDLDVDLEVAPGFITLTWSYSGDDSLVAGYRIEVRLDESEPWGPGGVVEGGTARQFQAPDPQLPGGLEGDIRLVPFDAAEQDGPPSEPVRLSIPGLGSGAHTAGSPTVLYDRADLDAKVSGGRALDTWVDGTIGIVPSSGTTARFIAANGSRTAITEGPLDDPAAAVEVADLEIDDLLTAGTYAAGGPVVVDPDTGDLLLIYHHERLSTHDAGPFYSALGLAVWVPDSGAPAGGGFRDLGLVVEPEITYPAWDALGDGPAEPPYAEVGGGALILRNGQLHIYFNDFTPPAGASAGVSVARAPLTEIRRAIAERDDPGYTPPAFAKLHDGAFAAEGMGGLSTPVTGYLGNAFLDIARDDCRDEYVMTYGAYGAGGPRQTAITTSVDGLSWSPPTIVIDGHSERTYSTIVGTSLADPKVITGATFTLLSTSSASGHPTRWTDTELLSTVVTNEISAAEGCVTAAPAAPTDLDHELTDEEIALSWTQAAAPSPATDFVVESALDLGGPLEWSPVQAPPSSAPSTATELRIPRPVIPFAIPVRVRVRALNAAGESSVVSDEHAFTIPAHPWLVIPQSTRFAVTSDVEVASRSELEGAGSPPGPGLGWYPGGLVARLPRPGGGFEWIGANSGSVARTEGTATHPFATGVISAGDPVTDLVTPGVATMGGPVLDDPVSGERFLFYVHQRLLGSGWEFYNSVGVAHWDGSTETWRDLGIVLTANQSHSAWVAASTPDHSIEIGSASFVRHEDDLLLYFTDPTASDASGGVRVARGLVSDLVAAAAERDDPGYLPPTLLKHHAGAFTEPGIGGDSTAVSGLAHLHARFPDVLINACSSELVMTFASELIDGRQTIVTTSTDGVTWSAPRTLYGAPTNERHYSTMLGSAGDYKVSVDGTFDLLTTDSALGEFQRFDDATLRSVGVEDQSCAP